MSPRLVLDYKVNPDVMWFGSLAKGYKAGGYNSVEVGSKFDNEDVWNFETGIKSVFPNAGVVLNTSAFYYVYDNKQAISLVTQVPGSDLPQYLIDTSDEQAWGIDVDAQWKATDHFTLSGNLEYLDATYKDKMTQGTNPVDLSGEPTGEPSLSAALGARYEWVLGGAGNLDLSGRYAYRGESRCNADSQLQGTCQVSPNFKVGEATQRLDARLGVVQRQREVRPRGLRDERAGRSVRDGRQQPHDRHLRHAVRVDLGAAHVGSGGDGQVLR